jgi:hypothetical protein
MDNKHVATLYYRILFTFRCIQQLPLLRPTLFCVRNWLRYFLSVSTFPESPSRLPHELVCLVWIQLRASRISSALSALASLRRVQMQASEFHSRRCGLLSFLCVAAHKSSALLPELDPTLWVQLQSTKTCLPLSALYNLLFAQIHATPNLCHSFHCHCLISSYLLLDTHVGRCCSPLVLVLKVSRLRLHCDDHSDSDAEPVAIVSPPLEAPACGREVHAPSPAPTTVTLPTGVLREAFLVVLTTPPASCAPPL